MFDEIMLFIFGYMDEFFEYMDHPMRQISYKVTPEFYVKKYAKYQGDFLPPN